MSTPDQTIETKIRSNLILDDLTPFEISVIGKSIFGLETPDLSMFLPQHRQNIFMAATRYIEEIWEGSYGRFKESSLVLPIKSLFSAFPNVDSSYKDDRANSIIEKFNDPSSKIQLLLLFEKRKVARKVVNELLEGDCCEGTKISYALESILRNYELVEGRELTEIELSSISEKYLQKSNSLDVLSHIMTEYDKRSMKLNIPKTEENISAFLDIVDLNLLSEPLSNLSEEEQKKIEKFIQENFNKMCPYFLSEKSQCIDWSKKQLNRKTYTSAAILVNVYLKNYDPQKDMKFNNDLKDIADSFIEAHLLIYVKNIYDKLNITFDFIKTYDAFIEYATSNMDFRELSFAQSYQVAIHSIATLAEADCEHLEILAEKSKEFIKTKHLELIKDISKVYSSLILDTYILAYHLNKKAGRDKDADEIETLFDEVKEKLSGEKEKDYANNSNITEQTENSIQANTERVQLKDILLSNPDFVTAAWSAYEQGGLFGIKNTRDRWVAENNIEFDRADFISPIILLTIMYEQKGITLDRLHNMQDEVPDSEEIKYAKTRILEYQFSTGEIEQGIGSQVIGSFLNGTLKIAKEKLQQLATGVLSNYKNSLGDTASYEPGIQLEIAEKMHELIDTVVPEFLYRDAAATALSLYSKERISDIVRQNEESSAISWISALECYRKLGHPGFIEFVEKNFGTF